MNKEKLSKTISLLMHQNLCVVNNATKENPDFVVGGTELLNKELTKLLALYGVVASLPSKDAMICEGYNKAKNEDYKNRNSLRHKSQDDYYSGWMDSYDFISKSKD